MLEARRLSKRYGAFLAVDRLSLEVRAGEVTGLLGPNGSGKSTTVQILAGLLAPSSGEVLLEGRPIHDDLLAFKRRLGYVPEEARLYGHLTGEEHLLLVGRLRGMDERPLRDRVERLLSLLALDRHLHVPLSSASKGLRQRVLLAMALLPDPDVLLVDEPLSGLDVASAMTVRSLLSLLAREGKAVLFSSHALDAVERTCSRVVVLQAGRVVAEGPVGELKEVMRSATLEDAFAKLALPEDPAETAASLLRAIRSR